MVAHTQHASGFLLKNKKSAKKLLTHVLSHDRMIELSREEVDAERKKFQKVVDKSLAR